MADVFISYSSKDRALAEALARDIEAAGWTVWWDPAIRAGENYRDVILRELDAAKAVVVIWTKNSVKSEWVISEAARAIRKPRDRYVAVREDGLDEHDIPPPFDVRSAVNASINELSSALMLFCNSPSPNAQLDAAAPKNLIATARSASSPEWDRLKNQIYNLPNPMSQMGADD